jgi:altronate dehydratase small subunit
VSAAGTSRAIVLTERDNIATLLDGLGEGGEVEVAGGASVVARQPIPAGHKLALRAIAAGEPVIKYGEPIGRASRDIAAGEHVHTHNVQSERGRGDRG